MQLNFVIAVLDREKRDRYSRILKSMKLRVSLTMLGHGTATAQHLLLSGLTPKDKAVIATIADPDNTKRLIREAKRKMYIDIPGNGIIMAVPIKSIGGASTLAHVTEHQTTGEGKPDMSFDYELVYVVLNEGHSDEVMDAARPAGAAGGTVIAAKGTGIQQAEKFMGLTLANEKEVVLIVAKAADKRNIMRAIIEKAGPSSPAGAVCFSLPVSQVAGLRRLETEDEE